MASEELEVPAPLLLSSTEKQILELHEKLQQLQFEIALLNAQKNHEPSERFWALYFLQWKGADRFGRHPQA